MQKKKIFVQKQKFLEENESRKNQLEVLLSYVYVCEDERPKKEA